MEKIYWMKDLGKGEEAIYIGHISSDVVADEELRAELEQKLFGTPLSLGVGRIQILRDLGDELRCLTGGSWYGADMWLIVKTRDSKKKVDKQIELLRDFLKEWQ